VSSPSVLGFEESKRKGEKKREREREREPFFGEIINVERAPL
jgi:hypothetical protein